VPFTTSITNKVALLTECKRLAEVLDGGRAYELGADGLLIDGNNATPSKHNATVGAGPRKFSAKAKINLRITLSKKSQNERQLELAPALQCGEVRVAS
jgi:hypothetical protein